MARYIDAEQFRGKHEVAEINGKLYSVIPYADIVYAPTSDVAPRAEVERLTVELDAMRGAANSYKMHYENAKAEVAREIFEDIFKTMNSIYSRVQRDCVGRNGDDIHTIMLVGKLNGIKYLGDEIAELKKKYTEEGK